MDCSDTNARLDSIEAAVNALVVDAEWGREDLDPATEVWDRLDRLVFNLMILRRDQAVALARRTGAEHRAITAGGAVTIHRETETAEQWDGHGVLQGLAEEVIDRDGELIGAVRLDTLAAVLPAVGVGHTSSKWKLSELRKILPNAEGYRKVTRGASLVRRGPMPAALRATRPPHAQPVGPTVDEH